MQVAHADWSSSPARRWQAMAKSDGLAWIIGEPEPAKGLPDADLIGFDFPIGVPRSWAAQSGVSFFPDALLEFEPGFYRKCEHPGEISIARPFYPARPGGTSRAHLDAVLGIGRLRTCDRAAGAAELFWTLGAKQAGSAAICGWRDVLAPALGSSSILLWPFHGRLTALLETHRPVVAECYPGAVCRWLGIPQNFGKRSRESRSRQYTRIAEWGERSSVTLPSSLQTGCENDDAFDAVVGLIGILQVILGQRPTGEPDDPSVHRVEGWILGLNATAHRAG